MTNYTTRIPSSAEQTLYDVTSHAGEPETPYATLLRVSENVLYRWLPYLGPRAFLVLLAVLNLRERREWRVKQGLEHADSEWIEASMGEVGSLVGLSADSVKRTLDGAPALHGILRYQRPDPHAHKAKGRGMRPGRWLVTPNALTPIDAATLYQALTERDALHDFVGAAESLMGEQRQASKLLPMLWRKNGGQDRAHREGIPTWPAGPEQRKLAAGLERPLTVMDVVREAAGQHGMDEVELAEVAKLENWYVGGAKTRFGVVSQAQLRRWVRELGPGEAVLLLLLCRLAESGRGVSLDGGRVTVVIPGGTTELAAALGCRRNLVDWWLDGRKALSRYLAWGRYSSREGRDGQEYRLTFYVSDEVVSAEHVRGNGARWLGGRPKVGSLSRGGRPKVGSLSARGRPKVGSLSGGGSSKSGELIEKLGEQKTIGDAKKMDGDRSESLSDEHRYANNRDADEQRSRDADAVELINLETANHTNVETNQPIETTPKSGGVRSVGGDQENTEETENILEDEEQEFENEEEWSDGVEEIDEEDWEEEEPEIVLGEEWERPEEESAWDLAGLLRDCYKVNREALLDAGVTAEQWVGLLLQYSAAAKVRQPYNLAVKRLVANPELQPDPAYVELGKLPPGRLLKLLTPRSDLERGRIGPEYLALMQLVSGTPLWQEAMNGVEPARQAELRAWLEPGLCWKD